MVLVAIYEFKSTNNNNNNNNDNVWFSKFWDLFTDLNISTFYNWVASEWRYPGLVSIRWSRILHSFWVGTEILLKYGSIWAFRPSFISVVNAHTPFLIAPALALIPCTGYFSTPSKWPVYPLPEFLTSLILRCQGGEANPGRAEEESIGSTQKEKADDRSLERTDSV